MIDSLKRMIKAMFPDQVNGYRLYRDLVINKSSYLQKTGWIRSLEMGQPVDVAGNPVPWINYPMVEFLRQRVPPRAHIFEYGSGNSTIFWASLASSVTSLEYDHKWIERIKPSLPDNATIHYCPADVDGTYCRFISTIVHQWDIVLVDGRDRVNCVAQAVKYLSNGGVIILDDSQRERYRPAFDLLIETGFRAISIKGLKPTGLEIDETTIFYRDGNCLGL